MKKFNKEFQTIINRLGGVKGISLSLNTSKNINKKQIAKELLECLQQIEKSLSKKKLTKTKDKNEK